MNVFRFLNHKDCDQQCSMGFCSSISVGPRTSGGQSDGELVARLNGIFSSRKRGPGASVLCSWDPGTAALQEKPTCAELGLRVPLHSTALGVSAPAPDPGALGEGPSARDPSSLDSGLLSKPPSVHCPNKCSASQSGGRGISDSRRKSCKAAGELRTPLSAGPPTSHMAPQPLRSQHPHAAGSRAPRPYPPGARHFPSSLFIQPAGGRPPPAHGSGLCLLSQEAHLLGSFFPSSTVFRLPQPFREISSRDPVCGCVCECVCLTHTHTQAHNPLLL